MVSGRAGERPAVADRSRLHQPAAAGRSPTVPESAHAPSCPCGALWRLRPTAGMRTMNLPQPAFSAARVNCHLSSVLIYKVIGMADPDGAGRFPPEAYREYLRPARTAATPAGAARQGRSVGRGAADAAEGPPAPRAVPRSDRGGVAALAAAHPGQQHH